MNFESLVGHINQVQDVLQAQAAHAVNLSLTARNWLVGYYIVEFEQHGEDRAKYGEKLLNRLAKAINRKGFSPRRLREYRQFYSVYSVLGVEVEKYINHISTQLLGSNVSSIWRSATAKLQSADNQESEIWRSVTAKSEEWATPPERLFYRINYTSLSILSSIDNPLKRAFYEQESIRGCWTNTELDRQISSQYYERMGLIHHSDRGVQYCCNAYTDELKKYGIAISMTEDYRPTDNAIAERVNGILKTEVIYREHRFKTIVNARERISSFISFYNDHRPHASIGMKAPSQAHTEYGPQLRMW